MNLDAFEGLAHLGSAAHYAEELDLHWDEVCVLAQLVWLLAEASGFEHDVAGRSLFVKLEGYLDVGIKLEEGHWFVWS